MNSKSDRKHLVTRLWRMLRPGRGWRTVLAIGTVAIYTAIFFPLYHVMDGGAAALSVIPVAAAGWLFGLRAGVLAGVLAFLFNTLLLNLAGQPGWDAVIRAGGVPGSAALLLIGAVVGRLHDLEAQAKRDIAERRRVEEALQKSEERLRTIVSNVPIILFAVDKAGVFTLSEGKGLEALRAKPGEVVGRSVADVYRNTPAIIEHVERALAGEPVTATVDVAGLTFEAHYTPVYGDDYEVTGVIGVAIDVTEQRRHQAEVEAARTFLQTLLESSPDSIIAADMNGRVTVFNPGAEELLGYSAAEILGQPVERLYPSREAAKAVMRAMRADPRGRLRNVEITLRHKDGHQIPVMISAAILRDANGQEQGTVGYSKDLTERQRAEKALADERNLLRTLIDNIPDYIFVKDSESRFVINNIAHLRVLRASSQDDVTGKTDFDIFPRELAEQYYADEQAVIRSGEPLLDRVEVTIDEQGRKRWLLTTKIPLRGSDGSVTGLVGISRDITALKEVQEELEKAKEAAEAAAQAKSEFLANMSHEIRTPLNAVIGMTGLLLDTPLNREQREYVETIRTSGDALLEIINDILDFSKIEAGKLELERQAFDVRACVEESLDLLAPRAAEKGLDLAYLIDHQVPPAVVGDVARVRQVLVNLLSNAVKFTERGEVVVSVTASVVHHSPEDTQYAVRNNTQYELHFSVRDTGIGIPQDRMDRLFESFTQVDASITRRYGGTGLGLTICKRLVEMMGGTIWVESEVGVGSTFHFTILAEVAPSRPQVYLLGDQPQLAGRRVLIVDDNATNRRILTHQLESWGMLPETAASGPEALNRVRAGTPYDLAILDMHMPDMDGLMLAAKIRQYRDSKSLPLVMLTSVGGRRREARDLGFAAYLTKPIKPSQLYNALVSIFAGQPVRVRESVTRSHLDPQMAQRRPLRILLAEDNAVNQKVALRLLARLGYRADVAGNGFEALQALERQPYDVVLMDVQMPEMDGVEATRRIRERWPDNQRPRIIAMTAHALSGDRERYLAAGMDDYISKPVRVEELVAALERAQRIEDTGCGMLATCPEPGRRIDGDERRVSETTDQGAPIPNNQSPINDEVLAQFTEMLGEDAPELIETYMEDATRLLEEMRAAAEQGDVEKLERAAHALKGSSATLGAELLSALCQELESMGRAGTLDGAAEKVADAQAEYERVRLALERGCGGQ